MLGPDELDVEQFDRLSREGSEALKSDRPEAAAEHFAAALGLWRGSPLGDLANQPFASIWVDELIGRRLLMVERRIDADLARGRAAELLPELDVLVRECPERERLWEQLTVALYRAGRQTEAAAVFPRARSWLRDELGLEPGPGLQQVARQVLQQDPALLGQPAARVRLATLPTPLTRIIGRDAAIAKLVTGVINNRLTNLVGPGGVGKTRLALAVAHQLDGAAKVVWVPLADAHVAAQILPALADATGLDRPPGRELEMADLRDQPQLADASDLLLLLDNLEHLAGAGRVVEGLLQSLPALRVLATSRSPLGVAGERVVLVEPLDQDDDAVELFVERAREVDPTFSEQRHLASVKRLCRQLDGLPLALELAAARASVFDPDELASRVSAAEFVVDPEDRHGSLRALVQWSIQLLDAPSRSLFTRLAVCEGGFGTDVAAAVAAPLGLDEATTRSAVAGLVAASLARPVETDAGLRFVMLSTVRSVALEMLGEERDEATSALCDLWIARSRATDPVAQPTREVLAATAVDMQLTRQVLESLVRQGRSDQAAQLVLAHRRALAALGRQDETLADARLLLGAAMPKATHARLSVVAGGSAYVCGDPEAEVLLGAVNALPEDDLVYRVLGNNWLVALNADRGDHEAALAHTRTALDAARRAQSPPLERIALSAAAWAARRRDDIEAAAKHCRAQLGLATNDTEIALSLIDVAAVELQRDRVDEAEAYARDAVTAARRLGPSQTLAEAECELGFALLRRRDATAAGDLICSALEMLGTASDELLVLEIVAALGVTALLMGRGPEGLQIIRRATALARVAGEPSTAVPRELASLARELALGHGDLDIEVPAIGSTGELAEAAKLLVRRGPRPQAEPSSPG